ncbi:MAG: hypothetical protein WD696_18690 [Bryobacteraceae bacterium]
MLAILHSPPGADGTNGFVPVIRIADGIPTKTPYASFWRRPNEVHCHSTVWRLYIHVDRLEGAPIYFA